MKKQKKYTSLLIGLILLGMNAFSQDPDFHIYLCFGQSNMEGAGAIETVDKTVDSRFKVMEAVDCSNLGRTKGKWYTAVPPLTRCGTGLSPVDYFGRTMIANLPTNVKVGVINVSVGGCKIELFDKINYTTYVSSITETWLKNIIAEYNGNPYGRLVEMAKLAQKDGVIKGILLHQGESNTGDSQWPAKVKGVYNNLITDLGLDPTKVPLLAGEVVHADQGGICASMNSIIAKLPQTLPNSYVISSSKCTDQADNLHFNSAGYRKFGTRYAIKMLSLMGYDVEEPIDPIIPVTPPDPKGTESFWFEAERFVTPTAGTNFNIVKDALASNEKSITVQAGVQALTTAPSVSEGIITISFTASKDTTYNLFLRLNCPSTDDDSFWMKLDNGAFVACNGLTTSGWAWLKITSFVLKKGQHKITIGYREDGAMLDKICISSYGTIPTGIGEKDDLAVGLNSISTMDGYTLEQNFPNPFNGKTNISFEIPNNTFVSLKVYNLLGTEIGEIAGKEYTSGKHTAEFDSKNLAEGIYIYTIKAGKFSASQKMILQGE
ncbi:MAG: T9SS type A sorting domain-containing protein [Prolixibacteraceae bacterium]|nr:T9SS type A sorting domain-containing protein [Prolixibacteraceae bacterium]